ncbi:MAG: hypothetical protein HOK21_11965 [Rhodospirillaceae bacterium]|jgi:hypothetical protein|nr:hypothetical protein [Rhodospirillaceae bacterium]MBT4689896.1 hypothetical protein [Rhodospirillaceae bacterium]MBT5081995.1 hypothetical protein [Rhodospirillaceae bacterium]MBT5524797.1 hypothetical protein [Rhodospirillaceae bacterium]MBT5881162.1 hypothetical protein [Rhodospirillaceae bacterium]
MLDKIEKLQRDICNNYGAAYLPIPRSSVIGISLNMRESLGPINGFRHPPQGETTGWFLYAGEELKSDPDFFHPLHVGHLGSWCPVVEKFLGLPPGWRFLIAEDYLDVWYDDDLLII